MRCLRIGVAIAFVLVGLLAEYAPSHAQVEQQGKMAYVVDSSGGLLLATNAGRWLRNHLILGRVDEDGPDPRFRLTALGGGRYGLSLYERNRWEPLPYEGTPAELVDVINTDLALWAAEWPSLPPT
jgi:hypothetical protein